MGNVRGALWAILGLLSWFSAFDARGDSAPRKIELTKCPTSLSLSLPPMFDGSTDERGKFKTDLINVYGKAVLALRSSPKPGVFLIVHEPHTADEQGTYTVADIEGMKARASKKPEFLAQESGDTWLTVAFEEDTTSEYHRYVGFKFFLASSCMVHMTANVQASFLTLEEFMAVMRAIEVK